MFKQKFSMEITKFKKKKYKIFKIVCNVIKLFYYTDTKEQQIKKRNA